MSTVNKLKRVKKELMYRRGSYYAVTQIDELIKELEGKEIDMRLKSVAFLLMLMLGFSFGSLVF